MENNSKISRQDIEQKIPLKNEKDEELQTLTTLQKLKYVKDNITVEPSLALFMIASVVSMLATQNLNLDKACRVNLNYNDSVCTALTLRKRDNLSYHEDEVQKLVASVEGWKSVVHTAFPAILMLFIGAWSDKTGRRKVCMLMPIFGEFSTCVINLINTYFFYEVPVEWTAFLAVIFPALSGAWYTMFLGVYSYVVDVTSTQTRTFRLGVLTLGMTIGLPVGIGLSGILLRYTGFYGVFSISGTVQLLNFLYIFFYIEDHLWLEKTDKNKRGGCVGFLVEFLNFQSLKETILIVFKKGPNKRRLRICLTLLVVCLTFGPMWGETSIIYIFSRYQFNWDEVNYSMYSTYSLILHTTGTMFSISVFSKKLKFDDSMLGIIASTSRILGALVWALAKTSHQICLAPVAESLNGTAMIALRSIASKLVSQQELGKVFSLFGLAETVVPLLFAPLYSKVYVMCLHVFPGAVFFITVCATIPSLVIFIWFFIQHRNQKGISAVDYESPVENTES